MFKLSALMICLSSVLCFSPLLVKGTCYQSPIEMCKSTCSVGIVANSTNINYLIEVLRAKNIESAYVYGWEDHSRIMILYRNGALVPYIPNRICSEYAFCYGACPCKPVIITGKSCCIRETLPIRKCEVPPPDACAKYVASSNPAPQPNKIDEYVQQIEILNPCCGDVYVPVPRKKDLYCEPVPHKENLCCEPVHEENSCCEPVNEENLCCEESEVVSTWDEISEDSVVQEECSTSEKCCSNKHYEQKHEQKEYPKKELSGKCIKKIRYRPTPKVAIKKSLQSKTYEYDCQDNELVLKIKEEIVSVNKINENLSKNGSNIPKVLHNPNFLFKLKHRIKKKYKHEVCLYVTDDNLLIAEIKGRMYYLKCKCIDKDKSKTQYHLRKIDEKKRKEFVRDGIHMIVFNYEIITQ